MARRSLSTTQAFVLTPGRAADVIVSLAEEHGVQLIVMGFTGAQGIQDAFAPRPGSIAYRVLSSTTVPVLVVPLAAQGARR